MTFLPTRTIPTIFSLLIIILILFSLINISKSEDEILINDYCNIEDSHISYLQLMDIFDYFSDSLTNNTCKLASKELFTYFEDFLKIQNDATPSETKYLKCKLCDKRFKTKNLLSLHQKLFHMNKTNQLCLGDFCRSFNCDRYKAFYDYKSEDTFMARRLKEKLPIEKKEDCDPALVPFYINNCMKLAYNCFGNDHHSYWQFYNSFCKKITCDFNKNMADSIILSKNSTFFEVLRSILKYMILIIGTVYIIVIIATKVS